MSTNSIVFELMTSMQRHISDIWLGDTYDVEGNIITQGRCPYELETMLTYQDRLGTDRIFGPSSIQLGRIQDNIMDLSNNPAVPSAYIEIYPNDPEQIESWRHSIYTNFDSAQNLDSGQGMIMVGGGNRFSRRFVISFTGFFVESSQNNMEVTRLGTASSSFLTALTKSRTDLDKPWSWKMLDETGKRIKDPLGESAWRSYPVIVHSRRRGGPPDDYIWDVKIYVEVATNQE